MTQRKKKLLFRRKIKHPEIIRNSTKACFTVMMCGSADGEVMPPYFVFKAKNKMSDWLLNGPKGSRLNVSDSGWVDLVVFEDWFAQHFLPKVRHIPGRKVIIGDNLAAHLSLNVLKLCQENNISFIFLPPNSTHFLQPLDVSFFAPLKSHWRQVLNEWRNSALGRKLISMPRSVFTYLIKKTLDLCKSNESANLIAGFKSTGIFPTNRDKALSKVRSVAEPQENQNQVSKVVGDQFINYIETMRAQIVAPSTRGKRFAVAVEPGKSVSFEELQVMVENRTKAAEERKMKKDNKKCSQKGELENVATSSGKQRGRPKKKEEDNQKGLTKNQGRKRVRYIESDEDEDDRDKSSSSELEYPTDLEHQPDVPGINSSLTNIEEFRADDFVVVNYEGSFFPGKINGFQIIDEEVKVLISAMAINGKNWKWPDNKDEIYYHEKDIVKKLNPSVIVPVNTRGDFKINDSFLNEKWFLN